LHQGVLLLALVAFPVGRLAGVLPRLVAIAGAVVAVGVIPQLGVAALFGVACGLASVRDQGRGAARAYPVAASASVAAVLVFSWWAVHNSSPASPLLVYEAVLFAVALGFPVAIWALAGARGRLADEVLGDVRYDGVQGLRLVLADVLKDPNLQIELCDPDSGLDAPTWTETGLTVRAAHVPIARVTTDSPAITDEPTRAAVCEAVRLAVVNAQLRDQQAQRLDELEATRVRLVAAADSERARIAHRLRTGAGALLDLARDSLPPDRPATDPAVAELIQLVRGELSTARRDLNRIAAGAPPVTLGEGRLHAALAGIAENNSIRVQLRLADGTSANSAIETALFYACSEALANASKHSAAGLVVVDLHRDAGHLVLSIRDDGHGGADASGSGLLGLADRMAAVGGSLIVASPTGQGTVVTAVVAEPV
jgi:signal transduction histidine kinase